MTFKEMGFSLNEIKSIFHYKRLARLTHYQESQYYQSFFDNKLKSVTREIQRLMQVQERLRDKVCQLSPTEGNPGLRMGVDIKALNLLKCLKCGGELVLSEGNVLNNRITNGKLSCSCGERYDINDGIILVNSVTDTYESGHDEEIIVDYFS